MTTKPKRARVTKANRAVLRWQDGEPVEWVYVVHERAVKALLARISTNPNSQVRRALRELGLIQDKRGAN